MTTKRDTSVKWPVSCVKRQTVPKPSHRSRATSVTWRVGRRCVTKNTRKYLYTRRGQRRDKLGDLLNAINGGNVRRVTKSSTRPKERKKTIDAENTFVRHAINTYWEIIFATWDPYRPNRNLFPSSSSPISNVAKMRDPSVRRGTRHWWIPIVRNVNQVGRVLPVRNANDVRRPGAEKPPTNPISWWPIRSVLRV